MVELNATYQAQLQSIAKTLSSAMPLTTAMRTITELDNTINEIITFTEAAKRDAGLPPATPETLETAKLEILKGQVLNMSPTQDTKGFEHLLELKPLQQLQDYLHVQNIVKSVENKVSGMYSEPATPAKAETQLGALKPPSIAHLQESTTEDRER